MTHYSWQERKFAGTKGSHQEEGKLSAFSYQRSENKAISY